jgi:D-arabinose 1-dehydrogenase-like Zn-dependent alcohol dehydrogenase
MIHNRAEILTIVRGDRLGFGWAKEGCGSCDYCVQGFTYHCVTGGRMFGSNDLDQGSFATHSVWPAERLAHIPDAISNEDAGPFMCAGDTVFVPLYRGNVKPTDRIGVVGIGGLGHLAVQFAAAWGCEVVVFSGSEEKREEAMKFGATKFYSTKDLKAEDVKEKIDHLLITTSVQPDWDL